MRKNKFTAVKARLITSSWGAVGVLVSIAAIWASSVMADSEKSTDALWKQYRSEDGIMGYEREVQRSKYLETRADAVVDEPIEVLLEVLKDIPSYPQWMHKCKETALLEQDGGLKRVLYFAQGVPLGSPDRDAVIEALTFEDWEKGASVTTLQSIDNHPYRHPKKKNQRERRRMIEFSGTWDLQMVDRHRTKVIYMAYTNPGGFAPKVFVDGVIRKVSFRSLQGMILKAKERKYIEAAEKGETKKIIEAAIKKGSLVFPASSQSTGE
jgi:hypothetical protein